VRTTKNLYYYYYYYSVIKFISMGKHMIVAFCSWL